MSFVVAENKVVVVYIALDGSSWQQIEFYLLVL